ncbi:defensin protein [Salix suchowensis]|nr:defensin protein [Salix suchowensis]
MARKNIFSIVLMLVLLLFIGLPCCDLMAAQKQCCTEHFELGTCLPGHDDKKPSGKCFDYCIKNCPNLKGGVCKLWGNKHHCHCLC